MNYITRFSQNFLRSPRLVRALIAKTNIVAKDLVYDIGAGKGIITDALSTMGCSVIAVEIDPMLARKLCVRFQARSNVVVCKANFLAMPLPTAPYKVFANIPFNLSADIVRKLTDTLYPPDAIYLVVQKEFADKVLPSAGGYNSQLSVLLGVRFAVRIVDRLRRTNFYPQPNVATVLIEIVPRATPLVVNEDMQLFRDFVVYGYNSFKPNVAAAFEGLFSVKEFSHAAETLGITIDAKPTQISLPQWVALFAHALQKPAVLTKLVGGYEEALEQKHHKRTKLHRTRPDRI